MPLAELKDYIQTEKHLPNVPTEEEVLANGLNMSEFQVKLLEKI